MQLPISDGDMVCKVAGPSRRYFSHSRMMRKGLHLFGTTRDDYSIARILGMEFKCWILKLERNWHGSEKKTWILLERGMSWYPIAVSFFMISGKRAFGSIRLVGIFSQ